MHALKRSTPAGALRVNYNSDWSGLARMGLGESEAEIPGVMARAIVDAIPPTDCRKACCYCHESYKTGDPVWRTTSGRMLMCSDCSTGQGGGGLAGHFPEITKDDDHEELDRLRAAVRRDQVPGSPEYMRRVAREVAASPTVRDPDLVRLVAALAGGMPICAPIDGYADDAHRARSARMVEMARVLLAEIDRPAEDAKL